MSQKAWNSPPEHTKKQRPADKPLMTRCALCGRFPSWETPNGRRCEAHK